MSPIDVDAALLFLDFVEERHQVWERRRAGATGPWTDDPILRTRKFTNVFRVLDYGSQYVLTDLIDPDLEPEDQLARLFLYRHTGRVEAWQYLDVMSGLPTRGNLDDVFETWREYRGTGTVRLKNNKPYAERGNRAGGFQKTEYGKPVFTSAYLVFPQSQVRGTDKLESIIDLTRRLGEAGVWSEFVAAQNQQDRFNALRSNKGVADFMSMQILTDWGYTPHCGEFRENDFVVAGPGARKGATALGLPAPEAIQWAWANMPESIQLERGDGPRAVPSYMDAQNCLCEFSKLVRYRQSPLKDQPYAAQHPRVAQDFVLPSHW